MFRDSTLIYWQENRGIKISCMILNLTYDLDVLRLSCMISNIMYILPVYSFQICFPLPAVISHIFEESLDLFPFML